MCASSHSGLFNCNPFHSLNSICRHIPLGKPSVHVLYCASYQDSVRNKHYLENIYANSVGLRHYKYWVVRFSILEYHQSKYRANLPCSVSHANQNSAECGHGQLFMSINSIDLWSKFNAVSAVISLPCSSYWYLDHWVKIIF